MGTMTVGQSCGSGSVDRLMKRDQRPLYRHWTDASPAKKISFGLLTLGAVAVLLVVFGPWKLTWSDADAKIHLEEAAQPQTMTATQVQPAPQNTVEVSVGMGPVSVKQQMTEEQFEKSLKAMENGAKLDGYLLKNMAAQDTPQMRNFNDWLRAAGKDMVGRELDYAIMTQDAGLRRHDVALLLRELPRDERERLYSWLKSMKIDDAERTSSVSMLEEICSRHPDNPAAQQIMAIVAYSKANDLFL